MSEKSIVIEDFYKTIIQASIDGFWIIDLSGHFIDVNSAYCQLIGYSREELLNMSVTDVEIQENQGDVKKHIQKIIQTGHDRFKTSHRCKNNQIIDIEVSVNYLDKEGGLMFVFIRNITEPQKAEEKFQILFDQSPDIYYIIDLKGTFLDGNKAAEKAIGYPKEELIGKNIANLHIMDPSDLPKAIKSIASFTMGKKTNSEEYTMIKKGGQKFIAHTDSALIELDGKKVILGVARDITTRKAAERQLLIQRDLALFLSDETKNLNEILSKILDYAIQIGEVDAGGIYLANKSGGLDLIVHKGLSENFISQVDHLSAESPQVQLANHLQPIYQNYQELEAANAPTLQESIHSIAITPIAFENKLVAVMNLASHTVDDLSQSTRQQIELLTSQIGSVVVKQIYNLEIQKEKNIAQKYLDIADVFIIALDKEGIIIEINKKGCEILGESKEALLGQSWIKKHILQEDQAEIMKYHKQAIAAQKSDYYHENKVLTKIGPRLFAWHNSTINDESGQAVGSISSGEDITEKRANEIKQKEYTNQLERLNKLMVGRELKMKELKQRIKIVESKKEDTI